MKIDFVHVVLATTVVLFWLVIIVGWLLTCTRGDVTTTAGRTKVPAKREDPSSLHVRQEKSVA